MDVNTALQSLSPATKGFFLQYVSLILIILTVLASTLTRPIQVVAKASPQDSLTFTGLLPVSEWRTWSGRAEENSHEAWRARATVLTNHDVVLGIEISGPDLEESMAIRQELTGALEEVAANDAASSPNLRVTILLEADRSEPSLRERWYKLPLTAPHWLSNRPNT